MNNHTSQILDYQKNNKLIVILLILYSLSTNQLMASETAKTTNELTTTQFSLAQFSSCLTRLKQNAHAQNISTSVINTAFAEVQHDPNVIKFDRKQPEFSESFTNYLTRRVTTWRINNGKQLIKQHHALLSKLQAKYGIPPHYIVSLWGLETNFGTYKGKMSILRSLITLACDQRRSEYFTQELLTALKLMESQNLDPSIMLGSWAGAMGHTQFMPSAYYQYAVDGDQDGQIDLFNSIDDALTSAANFLIHLGWQSGYRWGREVLLKPNFNYQHSGITKTKSLTEWHQLGVTTVQQQPLGNSDLEAALLVPAGHTGPAFLVYHNFKVIMRWNHSIHYALAVGHLADRIAGGSPLVHPPQYSINFSKQHLYDLQLALTNLGFNVGKPDGLMGPLTAQGIQDYQFSQELIADGFPDQQLFKQLGIDLTTSIKQ